MSFGKPTLPSGGIGSGPLKVEKWKVLSHAEEVWKYALGKLSAVEVQEFASAACKSGADAPEMQALQRLGSMGAIPGNIHRDLQRKYFHKLVAPAPWKITTNMLMKEDGQRVSKATECHVLLPHSWALSLEEGDLFEKVMRKDNDLVQFWKTQKQNPQMSSDMWRSLDFTKPSQLPVPYVLHGDGPHILR